MMNGGHSGQVSVDKVQVLNWVTRLGDRVLDNLFMARLPFPFLAGHSLGLAVPYLSPDLLSRTPLLPHIHSRIVTLWDSLTEELKPPSMRVLDSEEAAVGRFLRQAQRVGWVVCGVFVVPVLLRRLLGPSLTVLPAMAGYPALLLSTDALAVWAATGLHGLVHGLWSSHQVTNTLLEYKNTHPADIVPFLFPEHFDVGERAWGLVLNGAEWLGLARPQRRRQQKLKVFLVRLLLMLFGSVIHFIWLSGRSPKNSIPNIWAKCLGPFYFISVCVVAECMRL